jgi:hypothetical protein
MPSSLYTRLTGVRQQYLDNRTLHQAHPKYSEGEIDYNTLPTSTPTQQEGQTTARAEFPEEQTHLSSQDKDYSPMISIQPPEPRNPHLSQKDKLEAAYRQLITISEARFQFAGTVEALRKISGDVAHEALPHAKTSLDEAEQAFHESEVRRTLMLLDNNNVWAHYFMATEAFRKYKERTKDLVEEAMKSPSPLVRYVLRIDALLAGDRWRDDDPETGNEYQKMEKELNAMLKAMNKRLRLQFWAFRTRYG